MQIALVQREAAPLLLCLCVLLALSARAHPISLTTATVEVATNQVTATLEVMCEDFVMLYGYVADKDNYISRSDLEEGMKKHSDLLLRDFMLRDRDGQLLAGKLASLDSPPLPERGVLVDDLMQTKVVYHLVYPVTKAAGVSHRPGEDRRRQRRLSPLGHAAYHPPGRRGGPADGRPDGRRRRPDLRVCLVGSRRGPAHGGRGRPMPPPANPRATWASRATAPSMPSSTSDRLRFASRS